MRDVVIMVDSSELLSQRSSQSNSALSSGHFMFFSWVQPVVLGLVSQAVSQVKWLDVCLCILALSVDALDASTLSEAFTVL